MGGREIKMIHVVMLENLDEERRRFNLPYSLEEDHLPMTLHFKTAPEINVKERWFILVGGVGDTETGSVPLYREAKPEMACRMIVCRLTDI